MIKKYLNEFKELIAEFHPTKNGDLVIDNLSSGSHKKVWWKCSKGHEWEARIGSRTAGAGCKKCSSHRVTSLNCIATKRPQFIDMWHPTKNGNRTVFNTALGDIKKYWWKCKESHEWEASPNARSYSESMACPMCSGRKASQENNLTLNKKLLSQWDYEKNKSLLPNQVTEGTRKKVWWKCIKGHEWEESIVSRAIRPGICLFCEKKRISFSFNLATERPEFLAEWAYDINKIQPTELFPSDSKKVWWRCLWGHEWQSTVNNRAQGKGCPKCNSSSSMFELRILAELEALFDTVDHRYKLEKDEIDIFIPNLKIGIEYDGSYWHKDKHLKDKEKNKRLLKKNIHLLRVREYGLKPILKTDILLPKKNLNEWMVLSQILKFIIKLHPEILTKKIENYLNKEVFISEKKYKKYCQFLPGPIERNSLPIMFPKVASEWHPIKNLPIQINNIHAKSGKKFWWQCIKGHEWNTTVASRTFSKTNCPVCAGQKVSDINSLSIKFPNLVKEWHPNKNNDLKIDAVSFGSHKKVWWKCSKGHEWEEVINKRTSRAFGCPICSGHRSSSEYNLAILFPELEKQWDYVKNKRLPTSVTPGSDYRAWWKCSEGHSWDAIVCNRTKGRGCPLCRYSKKR